MRAVLGVVCFVLFTAPAWAKPCASALCRGPAPLLGLGIPAAIAIGSALFGARFFKRKCGLEFRLAPGCFETLARRRFKKA